MTAEASDVPLPALLLAAAGLVVLGLLVVRERRGRPLPPPLPDPFLPADPIGLVSLFIAAFVGQVALSATLRSPSAGYVAGPLAILLGRLLWRKGLRHAFRHRGGTVRRALEGLLVLWIALPFVYGTALLLAPAGAPPQETVDRIARRDEGWIPFALFALVVAPVLEEVAFRGALYPAVRRALGPRAALLATALLFGAVHMDHWTRVPPMAVFGLFLGFLVERTGSIAGCIAAHFAFNAISVGALLL